MSPEKNTHANEVQNIDIGSSNSSQRRKNPSYNNDAFIFKSEDEIKFGKEKEDIANNIYETPQSKTDLAEKQKMKKKEEGD